VPPEGPGRPRPPIRAAARAVLTRSRGIDRLLLGVLGVALLVRLAVLLRTPGYAPFGDPADYDRIAASLASLGDWPPTTWAAPGGPSAFRGPAYPYLLSWAYDLTGLRFAAARGLGVALGVASVALVWSIAVRVWDRRTAAVAGAICALLPSLAWLAGGLVAENLFVPLTLGAVLAALLHRGRPRAGWAVAVGVLCALAALTRSNGLAVAVPLVLALAAPGRRVRDPAIALLALAVVLAPWAVRNDRVLRLPAPLGTSGGYTLSGAWNPESARGGPFFAASRNPPDVPAWADLFVPARFDEAQLERRLRRRALRFGAEHPGFVLRASGVHLARQFLMGPGQARAAALSARELGMPAGERWTLRPPLLLLLALAALGAVLAARGRVTPGPWWLWVVPLAMLATTVPVVGGPRYRIPVDPFLALAAAVALVALSDARRRRSGGRRSTGGAQDPPSPLPTGGSTLSP
jgi:4-amino-4-deoxy-L-arabinose transferase-like glycosyltransferase